MSADYGSGEVLDGVVIASSVQPNNWIFIDPNKPSGKHEFTIIQWMGDTTQEFADLLEYFQFVLS